MIYIKVEIIDDAKEDDQLLYTAVHPVDQVYKARFPAPLKVSATGVIFGYDLTPHYSNMASLQLAEGE